MSSSFFPALFALAAITLAALALIDSAWYLAERYRGRYLKEARTELDDVLIQIPPARILDLSLALSALCAIIVVLVAAALESFAWEWAMAAALAAGVAAFPVPRLALKAIRRRRLHKFNLQLEDALGMMSGALKAGFSINQALEEISELDIHPIAVEFRLLMQEIRLGVPLDQALENMNRRFESDDFELVATAIITARQTGGELTTVLERVAGLIRERVRIAAKVRSQTAMGRLQALIIGVMPFLLLAGMLYISPEPTRMFLDSPLGMIALAVVVVLVVLGFLTIRRITSIEV